MLFRFIAKYRDEQREEMGSIEKHIERKDKRQIEIEGGDIWGGGGGGGGGEREKEKESYYESLPKIVRE